MQASRLLLHWELWLGTYSVVFVFFFFSFPVMLPSEIPKLRTDPLVWKLLLFTTPSPGQVSVPNSFDSLFVFYILSYLLLKRMCCLSGCLVSSTSIQKLFCGSFSAFKWSFDDFVGETVASPFYSSTILPVFPRASWHSLPSSTRRLWLLFDCNSP